MRIKSQPSTAQRLALFREDCRKYFAWLRKPGPRSRVKPSVQIFNGYAAEMAEVILKEETERHELVKKEMM